MDILVLDGWFFVQVANFLIILVVLNAVLIAPGEKHWHGAAPTIRMEHIAMQEAKNGKHVDWLEHVTDEQYAVKPGV